MAGRLVQSFRRRLLDRLILRPSRNPIDAGGKREIMLGGGADGADGDGDPIQCFVDQNFAGDGPPDLCVIKFPGTGGRAERSGRFPASVLGVDIRCRLWTWNPPGYGGSPGKARLDVIGGAAVRFSRHVIDRQTGRPVVWLCGNSLGCIHALRVASTLSGGAANIGLILRNPPPLVEVVKRIADRYPLGKWIGPVAESLCDQMNGRKLAAQASFPAVFLQSTEDRLVPPDLQDDLIARYAGPRRVVRMDGLDHDGIATDQHEAAIRAAAAWLWSETESKTQSTS